MISHTISETSVLETGTTMAASNILKVTNRSPHRPIKNLPPTIEVADDATVLQVKEQLSRLTRLSPDRLGIFDPEKKKILRDRKAFILHQDEIATEREILLSWTTVFIIEYLGPILLHFLVPFVLRPYIYGNREIPPLSASQYLSCTMIVLHFLKREIETIFVHKFSLSTMPLRNIFKNSAHYWIGSGVVLAYYVYHPASYTQLESETINYVNMVGVALYIFGEISNAHAHLTLSRLRSKGGTERGVPRGYGFEWVTCPNYLFEIIAWIGINLVTKSISTIIFIVIAWAQMHLWAKKKEKALRAEFPDTYKKKRNVIFPIF
ncbi:unnamed protein product [Blumeria hordei]|uniref:very-long-chain enoyl-CoA reductase n=1 Tax=Blumeria hordei TaxID=2867405 RepID=A0A383UTC8_BLUHO|nr:unnamed protein product [Blumeria hordei]